MTNSPPKLIRFSLILIFILVSITLACGQNKWQLQDDGCGAVRWYGSESGSFNLEIKEQTLAAPLKTLSIDGGTNGGVRIVGWDRSEIFVRACVQAFGFTAEEARARTSAVRILTGDGPIRAISDAGKDASFGPNFDIRVPFKTNLTIKTHNGGINLANIDGAIEFDLVNGDAVFNRMAGELRGKTVNGSLLFNLSGTDWNGAGIDASTVNGNISISVPENYSARLATATNRGKFLTDLTVDQTRAGNHQLNLDIGTGGALIKAVTNSGQVTIKRQPPKIPKTNE